MWPGRYWPPGFRSNATVSVFKMVLATYGYDQCADGGLEQGMEKLALYAVGEQVKHAARQLTSGRWTSKMGPNHDIEHPDVYSLEGPEYGKVVMFLRRKRR